MTGASITVKEVSPILNQRVIYFSGTTDASGDLDFSKYKSVDVIRACDAATLVPIAATAYAAGGDIRLAETDTAVKGIAVVNL
jgi:hypothetical protein